MSAFLSEVNLVSALKEKNDYFWVVPNKLDKNMGALDKKLKSFWFF